MISNSWYPSSLSVLCQIFFTDAMKKQKKKTVTKVLKKIKQRGFWRVKPYPVRIAWENVHVKSF